MRSIFLFLFLISLCGSLVGADHTGHAMDISKTDIFERTVNFIIFVALMWYLVADKLKNILRTRSKEISDKLTQTQTKLQESKSKKEKSQQRLKDAHEQVLELMKTAKQEAFLATQKIEEKAKEQVANMIKANNEAMEFQERLFQKQIVEEILKESFSRQSFEIDSKDYVGILEKKVA